MIWCRTFKVHAQDVGIEWWGGYGRNGSSVHDMLYFLIYNMYFLSFDAIAAILLLRKSWIIDHFVLVAMIISSVILNKQNS